MESVRLACYMQWWLKEKKKKRKEKRKKALVGQDFVYILKEYFIFI